jgi:tRNA1Val (adenine37-N6)-methyltransferase
MANPFFAFKKFTVYHDKCAMKVGTDGVMLGAWTSMEGVSRALDVGTGTGLIAIMMAQRSVAFIDAVEIDENAFIQAQENRTACPWKERIRIHHDSFQHFAGITPFRYDIIVSNPPYFRHSLKSPSIYRSLARHDENLSFESLLFFSSRILTPGGRLALIVPANDITRITEMAFFHHLYPSRMLKVRPLPGRDYSRCLAEFTGNRNQVCVEKELIIKQPDPDEYTADYVALTREYYLYPS